MRLRELRRKSMPMTREKWEFMEKEKELEGGKIGK